MKRSIFPFLCVLVLLSGCSSMPTMDQVKNKLNLNKPRAKYVVPFWEPVIRQQDGESKHGYAARVFFYDKTQSKPMKMEGAIEVYCFAEEGKITENKPTKIVTFRPEDTPLFYSKSDLGHSYTIWVPWDESDNPADKVSLIVKFRGKDGDTLMSRQATLDGPGYHLNASGKIKYKNADADTQVRQVAFMDDVAHERKNDPDKGKDDWTNSMVERVISKENGPSQMQTTTLTLPTVSRFSRGPVETVTTSSGPDFSQIQEQKKMETAAPPYTGSISPASYLNSGAEPSIDGISTVQSPLTPKNPWANPNLTVPAGSQSLSPMGFQPLSHYEPSRPQVPVSQAVPPAYDPVLMATSHGALLPVPTLR